MRLLRDKTNRYANQDKNKHDFKITLEEMMNFVGLILSGYNIHLSERDY